MMRLDTFITTAGVWATSALLFGASGQPATARPARGGTCLHLIVRCKDPQDTALLRQIEQLGGRHGRAWRRICSLEVTLPGGALGRLARLPGVEHVSPDQPVRKLDEFGYAAVGAAAAASTAATASLAGQGITVGVVDSGISPCNDLNDPATKASRILTEVVFIKDGLKGDPCGHGSHVAGAIAANGTDSMSAKGFRHFYGTAPKANLISLRALGKTGGGSAGDVISAVNWAITNKSKYNIRVLNLSLGQPVAQSYTTDPLCQICESAWKAGIVVVCAAGNRGRKVARSATGGVAYGTIDSPGNDPYVLTVGATNTMETADRSDDRMASYSSRGPSRLDHIMKPDIVAPGNKFISLRVDSSYLSNYDSTNLVPILY